MKNGITEVKAVKSTGGMIDTMRIAGAYVAYVIGSGFATGQEIVQFFTVYGIKGIAGMAVCTFLFSAMGAALLADGYRYGNGEMPKVQKRVCGSSRNKRISGSGGVYEYYCGTALGRVFELMMPVILFCTVVIMIAGAGAAVQEYYELDYKIGCTVMAIILFVSYMLGFHKIVNAIGFLAPVIIIFMITVGVITIADSGIGNFSDLSAYFESGSSGMQYGISGSDADFGMQPGKWFFSALLYASYNTVSAVAFFRALGSSAASAGSARAGGILGGVMLMTAALMMNLAIMTKAETAVGLAIPTLYLARLISPVFGAAFSAVLLIEIFSTAAPMMWTVCSRFAEDGTPKAFAVGAAFIVPAYLLSGVSFEKLIGCVYPCTGILGFVFMFCLLKTCMARRVRGAQKAHDIRIASGSNAAHRCKSQPSCAARRKMLKL